MERIRQIEAKALRKLKHPSRSRKLRSFLDNECQPVLTVIAGLDPAVHRITAAGRKVRRFSLKLIQGSST
jgi:hypothetical protein